MQPNQPQAPVPDPYGFIMNTGQQPPRSRIPLPIGGNSLKGRILLIAGGSLVLLILLVLLMSLFGGGSKDNREQLITIVQEQNEIVRVAGLATTQARTQTALNLSVSTSASVASSQQQLTALVSKKAKLNPKTVALKKDSKTDALLTSAAQNNQFDDTFIKTLQLQLVTYQKDVKTAYDDTTNKATKQVLQTAFDGVNTLLGSSSNSAPN